MTGPVVLVDRDDHLPSAAVARLRTLLSAPAP
jgi:hypothetical protein